MKETSRRLKKFTMGLSNKKQRSTRLLVDGHLALPLARVGVFTRGEEERKVNWDFRTQVIKASHVLSMDLEAIAHG